MRALPLWTTAVALAVTGCHQDEPRPVAPPRATATPEPPVLTAEERRRLRLYEGRIATHCVEIARSLVDPDARPSPREEARAFQAADDLVAFARAKPTAKLGAGQDVRLFLGDVIENLEGANCDPRMIGRLESGFTSIPP
jgi:hypothetical protein